MDSFLSWLERASKISAGDDSATLKLLKEKARVEGPKAYLQDLRLWRELDLQLQEQAIQQVTEILAEEGFKLKRGPDKKNLARFSLSLGNESDRSFLTSFFSKTVDIEFSLIPGFFFPEDKGEGAALKPFLLGRYPVRQCEWELFGERSDYENWRGSDWPCVLVSKEEIDRWLLKTQGLRLPDSREWRYASCAGNWAHRSYYWGDDPGQNLFWHSSNSLSQLHSVYENERSASDFGLVDMLGHVCEIVSDAVETTGTSTRTVQALGGAWRFPPADCKLSSRHVFCPDHKRPFLGFRLAKSLTRI